MATHTPDLDTVWTASTPASIEDNLRHLWESAARNSPVSRALMSNLVVVAGGDADAPGAEHLAEQMLADVVKHHPARVVLLRHHCGSRAQQPHDIRVGLLTFGPPKHRYGIEVIAVAVACLDQSLPSILRAVTRGDVPTTLWFSADLSVTTPASPLVEISRQMVYDSGGWKDVPRGFQTVAELLHDPQSPAIVDFAWRRLASVRRAIVAALDPRQVEKPGPDQVAITVGPTRLADAYLLWGWLNVKLGWPASAPRDIRSHESSDLHVRVSGADWFAEVTQSSVDTDDGTAAVVAYDTAGRTVTVSTPRETIGEALSDELTRLWHDETLEHIVRVMCN